MSMMSIFDIDKFIGQLDADLDDDWSRLSDDKKQIFRTLAFDDDDECNLTLEKFDRVKFWNIIDDRQKYIWHNTLGDNELFLESLSSILIKEVRNDLTLCCVSIRDRFRELASNAENINEEQCLKILRFYGKVNKLKPVHHIRNSGQAFSEDSDCRKTAVKKRLNTDDIHYNMFQDEQNKSNYQNFKRFEIGKSGENDASTNTSWDRLFNTLNLDQFDDSDQFRYILKQACDNLQFIQTFLQGFKDQPLENLTQLLFSIFLTDFIDELQKSYSSQLPDSTVLGVTGMNPLETDVTICKTYMQMNYRKNNNIYNGGDYTAKILLKSDLMIAETSNIYDGQLSPSEQLKQLFINCHVNVEMKRWASLTSKVNKSPLTQVALQSMARGLERSEDHLQLFSLLTDCHTLYCVYHNVDDNEYWVSRSIHEPGDVVLTICWLYLCSTVPNFEFTDKMKEWQYHEPETNLNSIPEHNENMENNQNNEDEDKDENMNNTTDQHKSVSGAANFECYMLPAVVSFEDEDKIEEEETQCTKWENYFHMKNHRKYGTPLPLTESILSLHDAQDHEVENSNGNIFLMEKVTKELPNLIEKD